MVVLLVAELALRWVLERVRGWVLGLEKVKYQVLGLETDLVLVKDSVLGLEKAKGLETVMGLVLCL